MTESRLRVVLRGGCNGAGKTTASRTLLAGSLGILTFVNADQIAQGLSGFDPSSMTVEASRIMLERVRELASRGDSFAFATLAGRTYAAFLREWRQAGYRVELFYFWLASVELSIERVATRVVAGGHDVPETTLRQRCPRSVRNFLTLYRPMADHWEVYDNSGLGQSVLVATGTHDHALDLRDARRWPAVAESILFMSDSTRSPGDGLDVVAHEEVVRRWVREAVLTHARMGRSVVGWQDGQLGRFTPREIFEADGFPDARML